MVIHLDLDIWLTFSQNEVRLSLQGKQVLLMTEFDFRKKVTVLENLYLPLEHDSFLLPKGFSQEIGDNVSKYNF